MYFGGRRRPLLLPDLPLTVEKTARVVHYSMRTVRDAGNMRVRSSFFIGPLLPALIWALARPAPVAGQVMIPGGPPDGIVRIHTSDMAIFMAREKRNDLPCAVSPNKPVLGFDLRFHSSYEVAVPLRALAGNGNLLTVLFQVTPVAHPDEPVFFRQRINVPPIEENASGDAYLQGAFDIGQGDYQVDWLMRDRMGRVCSSFWEVNAHLRGGDKTIRLNIEPSRIRQSELEQFKEEPPVVRSAAAADGVFLQRAPAGGRLTRVVDERSRAGHRLHEPGRQ